MNTQRAAKLFFSKYPENLFVEFHGTVDGSNTNANIIGKRLKRYCLNALKQFVFVKPPDSGNG
ncbi:uncharacterized protein ASCRUDRAFT_73256 [Ascoidea rubescens DSM 1968]|uniref:Uncharacterized protein n=1 Tax=Ascoidea rubescens DSM 1968 TaxID=1344418 RepID=A0A1D2VP41_9ASCO|nr:hypothetical protein ASCRUDRAFT_73256 [Ascoidea rubescens DSM 1968]ODV63381.1 hypothetical protein ASCRUDRAFT_73256 [Ascoidea rubescens DSM 1968]